MFANFRIKTELKKGIFFATLFSLDIYDKMSKLYKLFSGTLLRKKGSFWIQINLLNNGKNIGIFNL